MTCNSATPWLTLLAFCAGCASVLGVEDLRGAPMDAGDDSGQMDGGSDAEVGGGDAGDAGDGRDAGFSILDAGDAEAGIADAGDAGFLADAAVADGGADASSPAHAIGGTVSGLFAGESVVLQNGSDSITVSDNGAFSFPTALAAGASYAVTVQTQPSFTPATASAPVVQTCGVAQGSGTVGAADVTSVVVTCEGFGWTCPTGTVFTDSMTLNPALAPSPRWTPIVGTWAWDSLAFVYAVSADALNSVSWIGARPNWTDVVINADVRLDMAATGTAGGTAGLFFRTSGLDTTATANNAGKEYYASIGTGSTALATNNGQQGGSASAPGSYSLGKFYTMTVSAIGSTLSVSIDGGPLLTLTNTSFAGGSIGLRSYNMHASYKNISVTCQ